MIIAVCSIKGGVGKTTAAVHVSAALASRRGAGPVALLDSDATRAATGWAQRGPGLPFVVRPIDDPPSSAEYLVVDAPGGEVAGDLVDLAARAHRVLVPSPPSPLDLLGALATYRLLAEHGDVRMLLNRCPPWPQRDAIEARAMLTDAGVRVLRVEVPNRKPYATAALRGVTVRDVRGGRALWGVWPKVAREVLAA